jgi:hypothetical protein
MKTPQNRTYCVEDLSTGVLLRYTDYDSALATAKHLGLSPDAVHSIETNRVSNHDDAELLETIFEELKEAG